MDRIVSENIGRILYLCGAIEPHREGISKEVFSLHRYFRDSCVIGTSPDGGFLRSPSQGYFAFPANLLPSLRFWAQLAARNFQLIHVFHGIDCYHYLKMRGNKPMILTAISVDNVLSVDHYAKVRKIVVESVRDRDHLLSVGLPPEKVTVIYPGTDLSVFRAVAPPPIKDRFRVVFASSPFAVEYMESRGVRLMLEAAKARDNIKFVLLWRKRGNTIELLKQWIAELGVTNVTVIHNDLNDMSRFYQESHAAIVPFTTAKNTKSCPNSAVESLATGRPVLASSRVGIADVIVSERCGVVFEPQVDKLVQALDDMIVNYAKLQSKAERCAQTHFSNAAFFESYNKLYCNVLYSER
ncbi:glycosyl transferase, group 1 [Pelobacter propionicus DSM 2379]|uniref:Glycosyl transferase, group 1 n=1 Tax=Pelobacter propionicus (strain DSM 2379 / NBRC 103807 / OttBd1) TaxID=338966 RepID=A1ARU5_PELPD|nr:glycosyl transferase, group 1 [Pelobacter propionicus DSM 2379]